MSSRLLAATALVGILAVPTSGGNAAGPVSRCAGRFPAATFDTTAEAGPVMVHGSGISQAMTDRFADDFGDLVDPLQQEMGGLEGTAVCIFDDTLPLDGDALDWPSSQRLRAVAFGEEKLVVLSAWLIGTVPEGGHNGLLHVAQWQASAGDYPEPFGNDVKGWYRNRLDGTVEAMHTLFVRQSVAEPLAMIPWSAGEMTDPLVWNPEFGYGGGGDFTNFVVAREGVSILTAPSEADLVDLDRQWRAQLSDEAGNPEGGTRGWVIGLVAVVGVVILAVLMALWARYTRKRIERELREAATRESREPVEEEPALVRPSAGPVRRGGRNPRVRDGAAHGSVDRDQRDRSPAGGARRADGDRMAERRQSGDDIFRHPGFDGDG